MLIFICFLFWRRFIVRILYWSVLSLRPSSSSPLPFAEFLHALLCSLRFSGQCLFRLYPDYRRFCTRIWTPGFCRIVWRPSQDQKWVRYECGTWCRQIQGSSTLEGGDTVSLTRTGFCLRHNVPVLRTVFVPYSRAVQTFMQHSDSQKLLSIDKNIRHHNQ
jgi:hypothetical protein